MSIYLGIDIGTSGFRQEGRILASAVRLTHATSPSPLERAGPRHWWRATIGPQDNVRQNSSGGGEVELSGQMHGSVFLDKNDKIRGRSWNDQRTSADAARWSGESAARN